MKIAVSGKGGVGKTTVAATLSRLLARDNFKVLAVDVDSNPNLGIALGLPPEKANDIVPICENHELIHERVGGEGGVYKLNPKADDIASKFGVSTKDNVNLLVVGTVRVAGTGCMCPAGALIKALLRKLILEKDEIVVLDLEAGLEHLGRGIVKNVDILLVVLEPNVKSIITAKRITELAKPLGVKKIAGIVNKILDGEEKEKIQSFEKEIGIPILVTLNYDPLVFEADSKGIPLLDYSPSSKVVKAIKELKNELVSYSWLSR